MVEGFVSNPYYFNRRIEEPETVVPENDVSEVVPEDVSEVVPENDVSEVPENDVSVKVKPGRKKKIMD